MLTKRLFSSPLSHVPAIASSFHVDYEAVQAPQIVTLLNRHETDGYSSLYERYRLGLSKTSNLLS